MNCLVCKTGFLATNSLHSYQGHKARSLFFENVMSKERIKMATTVVSDTEQQSDETFELLCSPCKRKDRNTEAEMFCADCNDYYCSVCVRFHEEIPALSAHKVTDKGQAHAKPTERCAQHRFTLVDMYCQNHDVVGCFTCMAVDHRACKDIFDIPEYVQDNREIEGNDCIQKDLQKVKESLQENIDACNRELTRLLKNKEDALLSLHDYRNEINKRLDELEQKSIAAIEEKYNKTIEKINEEIRLLGNSHEEVKSAIDRFSSSGRNVSQLFITCKKGKRSIESAKTCSEEASTRKRKFTFQLKVETELLKKLKDMNDLGTLSMMNKLLVTGNKQQYNIRHNSDKETCTISSACIFEDGSVILADTENKNLKRLDRNYTVIDVCELQFEPWHICLVDNYNVAGIARGGETIYFFTVGEEMTKTREIKTFKKSYGIAAANDNLYVTDENTSVVVYSKYGIKLKEFSKDRAGQNIFQRHYGIVVSDNEKIYVADEMFGLVVLSIEGALQGKYDCSEVDGVSRVYLVENGSVLVCGTCITKNCILQFNSEGKKLGVVKLSDTGNSKIGAVCYDPLRYRLLVGRPDTDEIDIYDLL